MSRIRMDVPFAMIPEWVVKAEISSHAVRLYCALVRYANLPEGAIPGRKTLAQSWLHVSLDTLDRAQLELIEIGALSKTGRPGHTNLYTLHSAPNGRTGAATRQTADSRTGAHIDSRTGAARKKGSSKRVISSRDGEAKPRERDPIWDQLTEMFGPAETHGSKSLRGKIVKSLKEAGATPLEIVARAKRYPAIMPPGTLLTETALEKHWPLLATKKVTPPCSECEMGGGLHAADCTRAKQA